MTGTEALRASVCLLLALRLAGPALGSSVGRSKPTHPLQQAAHEGNVERVTSLLAEGQDQYLRDSALRFAIRAGHREVTDLLISHGARDALLVAAEEGDLALAKQLLDNAVDTNERDSALHAAVRGGHKELVELLLSHGADVSAVTGGSPTPLLIAAAMGGDLNTLRWLADSPPEKQRSAPPAPQVFRDIVRLLIDRGADVNTRGKDSGFTALHYAIWGSDKETVEILLDHGAAVNPETQFDELSWYYVTPLHLAARYGDLAVCELLIARGADVNSKMPVKYGWHMDNPRQTPLYHAVETSSAPIARLLIDHGAQVNIADGYGETVLHRAVERADRTIVELLLSHGADANAVDSTGQTPLHYAAKRNHAGIVAALLAHGADANRKSRDGQTPVSIATQKGGAEVVRLLNVRPGQVTIHSAASMGEIETLERLVNDGVEVSRLDVQGQTALHAAVSSGQLAAVQWLLAHGADPNLSDDEDMTPLSISLGIAQSISFSDDPNELTRFDAVKSRHKEIIAALIRQGALPRLSLGIPRGVARAHSDRVAQLVIEARPHFDYIWDETDTLLHWTAWWGKPDAVASLIELGAEVNVANRRGLTPLHFAIPPRYHSLEGQPNPYMEVIRLLISNGADVNGGPGADRTPLHGAACSGDLDIITLLIEYGASVNAVGNGSRTPLHSAAMRGATDVMTALIVQGADPNAADKEGNTPLLLLLSSFELRRDSSKARIKDYAITLLRLGAQADVQNTEGVTPLQLAAALGFRDLLDEFLNRGAAANRRSAAGWAALHSAVLNGNAECVDMLLKHGARVDSLGRLPDAIHSPNFGSAARTPVHIAASQGNDEVVRLLIAAGADVNAKDSDDGTPLCLAYRQDHPSTIELLLDSGADCNARFPNGIAPVYCEAAEERRRTVDKLLQHGAHVDAELVRTLLETGTTPLHEAAKNGNLDWVKQYVAQGKEVNIPDRRGATPIGLAIANGHEEIARLLIPLMPATTMTRLLLAEVEGGRYELIPLLVAHGADLNSRDFRQETPLHRAVNKHNVKAIELLLAQGADINAKDVNNETPLGAAVYREQKEIVALLLAHGAEVNNAHTSHGMMRGQIPLHIAIQRHCTEIAEMLVRSGSDVNVRGGHGGPAPLHMVLDDRPLFELMLEHGGQIDIPSTDGTTCLHMAARTGNDELAQYLIGKGASVNVQDRKGNTPLHLAAKGGHGALCKILLAHGADTGPVNHKGLLALHYARASDLTDILVDLTPKTR